MLPNVFCLSVGPNIDLVFCFWENLPEISIGKTEQSIDAEQRQLRFGIASSLLLVWWPVTDWFCGMLLHLRILVCAKNKLNIIKAIKGVTFGETIQLCDVCEQPNLAIVSEMERLWRV